MIDLFKNMPLFKGLDEIQLIKIQEICTQINLNIGETFVREGEIEQRFFVILEGNVEILKRNGDRFYPLAKLSKGETVGEMVLFENAPRSASAKAIEPCTLLCFDLESKK